MAELDARRTEVLGRSASTIQRKVRTYLSRKHFILLRLSSIKIQALCRGNKHFLSICDCIITLVGIAALYILIFIVHVFSILVAGQVARHHYERMRREAASLNIQKNSRKFLARKAYKNLYISAVSIQAGMRGMTDRNELLFRRQKKAATVIQVKIKISFSS